MMDNLINQGVRSSFTSGKNKLETINYQV